MLEDQPGTDVTTQRGERDPQADAASSPLEQQADQAELGRLTQPGVVDRAEIAALQAQSVIDHEMIVALSEQGELDQAEIGNLKQALVSARRIGAAIGILMATRRVDQEGAFLLLRNASQTKHIKLRDVADEVIYTGALE